MVSATAHEHSAGTSFTSEAIDQFREARVDVDMQRDYLTLMAPILQESPTFSALAQMLFELDAYEEILFDKDVEQLTKLFEQLYLVLSTYSVGSSLTSIDQILGQAQAILDQYEEAVKRFQKETSFDDEVEA